MNRRIFPASIGLLFWLLFSWSFGELIPISSDTTVAKTFGTTTGSGLINIESLIYETYRVNPSIAASKYDLDAAEFAFKEFERNLSQFTPLKVDSSIERETNKLAGSPATSQHTYSNTVGFEKDYFNGGMVSAGVGHEGEFGDDGTSSNPIATANASFPLFSSYETLNRIIDRSFEENQLYSTRLEYVSAVNYTIQGAQVNYIWLEVNREQLGIAQQYATDLRQVLSLPRVAANPAEKKQIEGELESLQSDLVEYDGDLNSERIALQSSIGCETLSFSQIEPMDLCRREAYYGKEYLQRYESELLAEAERNDVDIKIRQISKRNSEMKRNLALKGKWDVFLNLDATYDFMGYGLNHGESGYDATAGFSIKLIDPKLLNLSLKKAEAEIKKYDAQIYARKLSLKNSIDQEWRKACNQRKQANELFVAVESRKKVYQQKLTDYIAGKETVDNLLQSRKFLYDTEIRLIDVLGEFYESITELDRACNVYFQKLNIDIISSSTKNASSVKTP